METMSRHLRGVVSAIYGIPAYQFDLPDDIEHSLVTGDISDRLHAAGGFAVLLPSIAEVYQCREPSLFSAALTALLSCLRTHHRTSCRLQRDMRPPTAACIRFGVRSGDQEFDAGHRQTGFDYTVPCAPVVCNPLGYQKESTRVSNIL